MVIRKLVLLFYLLISLLPTTLLAQSFNRQTDIWHGAWISVPNMNPQDYGVCYFRKQLSLDVLPAQFIVYVTGDSRYKFYVNDQLVSVGPARSDFEHWKVSTLDLAPYLKVGENVFAAQVVNFGTYQPVAIYSKGTAFLLDGEEQANILSTDSTWLCIQDGGYSPIPVQMNTYYVAGPGEQLDMTHTIKHWHKADCDLTDWQSAQVVLPAYPHDCNYGTGTYEYLLVDNNLPEMERTPMRLKSVRHAEGLELPAKWPAQTAPIVIPAHSVVDILLDNEELTNAYFNLIMSGGLGASIRATYCESLFVDAYSFIKSHRNQVKGLEIVGREDVILCNGSDQQIFQSLEWRTYRYINLHIQTDQQPLSINDLYGTFTGFPFELRAGIDPLPASMADSPLGQQIDELSQMLEIGWRTQRLCAYETYMDCPYYEQLQYWGDTRIQALITLYNTSDDRLVKNFLTQANLSRNAEGITQSRYPTSLPQYIVPYALSYIYALGDYMRYGTDEAFVHDLMQGAEDIIAYFTRYQQSDGRIKGLPGWHFSDWVEQEGWSGGVARRGDDGCSALMDLQFLYALQILGELEEHFGNSYLSALYRQQAERIRQGIQQAYWDETRQLYADASDRKVFSQHTGSLAILTGMIQGEAQKQMAYRLLQDKSLAQCTVYYKFYLHQALIQAGLGDDYLSWLDIWRENIRNGLTTWAETSDLQASRSDCHAWGASPNIEIFRTLLGIDSDAYHFQRVRIKPHIRQLASDPKGKRSISGTMPHPAGQIRVAYLLDKNDHLKATIELPDSIQGVFVWDNKEMMLHAGLNHIEK